MAKQSADNAMMERDEESRRKGSPARGAEPPRGDETAGLNMKIEETGENEMGGVHKGGGHEGSDHHMGNSGMGAAVDLLMKDTERGPHAPEVGGSKVPAYR
jgi:hypothetical protein